MAADPAADRVWFTLDTASKPVGPYTVQEIVGELLGCGAAWPSPLCWQKLICQHTHADNCC